MSRPLRLDHAGAIWHVTSRGNERREIFRDDKDRERFLTILGGVVQTLRWRVHAYVLMGNHYHLLAETPEPTLSRGMRHLNGVYTQGFNRRHGRVGHLLQGRFKAILVEKESHRRYHRRDVSPVRGGGGSGNPGLGGFSAGDRGSTARPREPALPAEPSRYPAVARRTHKSRDLTP